MIEFNICVDIMYLILYLIVCIKGIKFEDGIEKIIIFVYLFDLVTFLEIS